MKRSWSLALVLVFASAAALAATGARYRILMRDGSRILAASAPVRNGSVVVFRAPDGKLTGIPEELVVGVEPGAAGESTAVVGSRPRAAEIQGAETLKTGLEPGEILVLGPTGEGAAVPADAAATAAGAGTAATTGMGVGGAYGGTAVPQRTGNPPVMPLDTQTQTNPNGFPATATTLTSTPAVGPNGTPILIPGTPAPNVAPNGTPVGAGTANPNIGQNGQPVLAQPGQPGATPPTIGPNGQPVLAQPGQPGSAPPAVGPNGTPVLAPSGQPGSAPPPTAPNGTPASPGSAAPATAPNGTPASPAPSGAAPSGGPGAGSPGR